MTLSRQIKCYASEDIGDVINSANAALGTNMKVKSIKFDKPDFIIDEDVDEDAPELIVTATATISENNKSFNFSWEYMVDGDSIYVQSDNDELTEDLINRYREDCNVTASTTARKQPIMAAGEDDFDELSDDMVEDDDTFEDSIDDLADQVDDLQDTVDDVNEDDPKIEADNNISNHYIAECDNCHGIFISAVVESDQAVKSITGTCPLCEKDTEQLLKWVIKDVSDGEQ